MLSGLGISTALLKVLAGSGFEADFGEEKVILRRRTGVELAEPLAGIVDLDRVQAVAVEVVEQFAVVAHQPDDELALRRDASIDAGVLDVLRLAVLFQQEADLGMGFDVFVDRAGTGGEDVVLSFSGSRG